MPKDNVIDLKAYKRSLQEEIELERAVELSAQNMGIPDYYICGECGECYTTATFFMDHRPCIDEDM